jgi:hypothetical protein
MAFAVLIFTQVISTQQNYANTHPSSPKSDNKQDRYGQKLIYALQRSMTFTVMAFKEITFTSYIFADFSKFHPDQKKNAETMRKFSFTFPNKV